jgi:hypothetical protein
MVMSTSLRITISMKAATLETYKENGIMEQLRSYVTNYIIIEEHASKHKCVLFQNIVTITRHSQAIPTQMLQTRPQKRHLQRRKVPSWSPRVLKQPFSLEKAQITLV